MDRRNWLDLSRKLVDRYDMDFSFAAVQEFLGEQALSFFGEGVLVTYTYPNPFPVILSGVTMTGTVGNGIGYDPNGQLTQITPSSTGSPNFTIPAASAQPRWDLLVLRYKATGDTLVPKPSDPISTIFLNLHDDFELAIVEGTPSVTPVYPSKGPLDIILAGIRVPTTATKGTDCTLDTSIRELAIRNGASNPVFKQETPAGTVNGSNKVFTISATPINAQSVLVFVDDLILTNVEFAISSQTITLVDAPALGQSVYVWYIVDNGGTQNPLSLAQEVPSGVVNGTNALFSLVGKPADKDSTQVYVDGVLAEGPEWNLIQGVSNGTIQFNSGSIPTSGQDVYVVYFVNPATVGVGGGGGSNLTVELNGTPVDGAVVNMNFVGAGVSVVQTSSGHVQVNISGGGGGSYIKAQYGTVATPSSFTPSAGLAPGAENEQTWLLQTSGGAQTVTATKAIADGSINGQRLNLCGMSDTDYYTFNGDSTLTVQNLRLNGPCILNRNQTLVVEWNGTFWNEITRRN